MLKKVSPAWVVSTVNPKLNIFEGAAPMLALLTVLLTISTIIVVLLVIVTQCNQVCTTIPVFQVDPSDDSTQCVALRANDVLSPYDGLGTSEALHSSVLVGKCSVLHLQQCAQNEWDTLTSCLASLNAYADTNAQTSAAPSWLSIMDAFNADPRVVGKCQAATSLASGAACGTGSDPSDTCWLLNLNTINPDYDDSSCSSSLGKSRCSQVMYRAAIYQQRANLNSSAQCFPGSNLVQGTLDSAFNVSDPTLCAGDRFLSDAGVRCLAVRHTLCQEVDGGGAGLCLRFDSSDASDRTAEPGILFGPGVLATTYAGLGFTRDQTGHCSPWPMRPSYTSAPVMRGLLAALAGSMQDSLINRRLSFLKSGTIDISATTSVSSVMDRVSPAWIMQHPVDLGGGPLNLFFVNTGLYCCSDVCPTWLSAIGSALGFAMYIEMLMMFVVVVIYLTTHRKQAQDLGISIKEIVSDIVINQQETQPSRFESRMHKRAESRQPSGKSNASHGLGLGGASSPPLSPAARLQAGSTSGSSSSPQTDPSNGDFHSVKVAVTQV